MKNWASIFAGFIILFFVYHFPEFFSAFWIAAVFKIGFLVVAVIVSRIQGWKILEGYGLSFSRRWFSDLPIGVVAGMICFSASITISLAIHAEQIVKIHPFDFFLNALPMTMLMTFFPSIAEDILTRGYLYGHLKKLKPFMWVLVSAAIYVLNHIWRLTEDVSVIFYLFALGLVLAYCVIIRKSIWLALGIHWGANLAFELSNQGLQTHSTGSQYSSNWILGLVWLMTFCLLVIINKQNFPGKRLE